MGLLLPINGSVCTMTVLPDIILLLDPFVFSTVCSANCTHETYMYMFTAAVPGTDGRSMRVFACYNKFPVIYYHGQ